MKKDSTLSMNKDASLKKKTEKRLFKEIEKGKESARRYGFISFKESKKMILDKKIDNYIRLRKLFEENSNQKKAIEMARYMRDLFPFYGIATPNRKALYKDLLEEEKRKKVIDWDLLDKCYKDEHREMQYFVIDYLMAMNKYLVTDDLPRIKKYALAKQWWDSIDLLSRVISKLSLKDNKVGKIMLSYSLDNNFWLRRIAIIHQLGLKGKTNTNLLEKIIVNNLGNKEFFINKAIGWALRDYSRYDSNYVKDFINKYKDKMDRLSIREADKYL